MNVMSHFVIENAGERHGPEWRESEIEFLGPAKNIVKE